MRENAFRGTCMINLRFGVFAGRRYSLGILPILLPRLKTHLLPWVRGGKTGLPIIDGRDIGQAVARACLAPQLPSYSCFNIIGPEVPSVRQVVTYISETFGYPRSHFSVPFFAAYSFAWLMEKLDPLVAWEPLITRSIVHLLEDTDANNDQAREMLGYSPEIHWKEAVHCQIEEMQHNDFKTMKMYKPVKTMSVTSTEESEH